MNIYSFLESPDIAAHCEKIGHIFNPLEVAIVVKTSGKSLKEKQTAWHEIISDYPDTPIPKTLHNEAKDSLPTIFWSLSGNDCKRACSSRAASNGYSGFGGNG